MTTTSQQLKDMRLPITRGCQFWPYSEPTSVSADTIAAKKSSFTSVLITEASQTAYGAFPTHSGCPP